MACQSSVWWGTWHRNSCNSTRHCQESQNPTLYELDILRGFFFGLIKSPSCCYCVFNSRWASAVTRGLLPHALGLFWVKKSYAAVPNHICLLAYRIYSMSLYFVTRIFVYSNRLKQAFTMVCTNQTLRSHSFTVKAQKTKGNDKMGYIALF